MDILSYLNERVEDQIKWYSDKATCYKTWYKILQTIEIVLAAIIPLLTGYSVKVSWIPFVIGCIGVLITIIESLSKLNKLHENWIHYRSTSELLKFQKHLFITRSSPYNNCGDTIENLFVKNIEQIISSENGQWKSLNVREAPCADVNHSNSTSS